MCRCSSPARRSAAAQTWGRAVPSPISGRRWRTSSASAGWSTERASSGRSRKTQRPLRPQSIICVLVCPYSSFLCERCVDRMTTIREQLEARERDLLAAQAAKSASSRGRLRPEPEDDVRPAFQRDRDRIIHCKAFRRLKHKTQVFFAPTGDHYRTRLTHTLEVSQIARTIAKVLRLHEELTEAIALGHDLGHTPFGHAGERVIDSLMPGGFNHYEQSLRIVDRLENNGEGLNLTWEVRDGIAKHSKGKSGAPVGMAPELRSSTVEGQIMRVADLIAYVNHDIDDATRAGILRAEDLPEHPVAVLGHSSSARIGTLVKDVVTETLADG